MSVAAAPNPTPKLQSAPERPKAIESVPAPMPSIVGLERKPHRWTYEEYMRLGEAGLFPNHRTELIDGEIYDVSSQNNPHVAAISNANRQLVAAFDESYWLTIQSAVKLRRGDTPEPDLAIRSGPATGDQAIHPHPLLVIEVSDTSLLYDQVIKSSLYAANGVADYWIVNIEDRQLEVYRNPVEDATRGHGWRYAFLEVLRPPQIVTPLSKGDVKIEVARLLP
jgi:Uma2 family endonuclease